MDINIIMFREFRIEIGSYRVLISEKERELLALLIAAGGRMITAKNFWEIVVKPKKYAYNANFYSSASKRLHQSLTMYGANEIVEIGFEPVRFCRIKPNVISCDYYDMLDGKQEMMKKEYFLPEFPWASEFYCQSRQELNDLLASNPLFEN